MNVSSRLKWFAMHGVVRNVAALYGVQAAHFLFPLITLPYLARVLKPAEFGLVLLAQSAGSLVNLVIDSGFGGSAVRRTAGARGDRDVLADAVAGILGAKMLLTLGTSGMTALALVLTPLQHHPGYLLLAWLGGVASGLKRSLGLDALRDGWYIFAGTVAVTLYTVANAFILGFFVTTAQLALFAGPERLIRAMLKLTGPLSAAIYPRINLLVSHGALFPHFWRLISVPHRERLFQRAGSLV